MSESNDNNVGQVAKQLKDLMEAADRLRARKKELKQSLGKDSLGDEDEIELAEKLAAVCKALVAIEKDRDDGIKSLAK